MPGPRCGGGMCAVVSDSRNQDGWGSKCAGVTGDETGFYPTPFTVASRTSGDWALAGFPKFGGGHDLLPIQKDHDTRTILMCSCFCMTSDEFEGIDVYFKSPSQQLMYDTLYKEIIFLTTVSLELI